MAVPVLYGTRRYCYTKSDFPEITSSEIRLLRAVKGCFLKDRISSSHFQEKLEISESLNELV